MIKWIIAVIIALLVVSYIVSPEQRFEIERFFKNLGEDIKNVKIDTPIVSSCEKNAIEMTPKYWLTHDSNAYWGYYSRAGDWGYGNFPTPYNIVFPHLNKWNDGNIIRLNLDDYTRAGFGSGENINYRYYNDKDNLEYSKDIIDKNGLVLGTNHFGISPVFKVNDNFESPTYTWWEDTELSILHFNYSGFNKNIKKMLDTDKFEIIVKCDKIGREEEICREEFSQEEGDFDCDYSSYDNCISIFSETEPDIFNNLVYEIIEYNIKNCEWVKQ
ncbi:MAG: hypothetical protein ABIH25_05630 [Candidatus Woesearchaeota archaeon]